MSEPRDPGNGDRDAYVVVPAGTGRRGRLPLVGLAVAVAVFAGLAAWGAIVAPEKPSPGPSSALAVVSPSPSTSSSQAPAETLPAPRRQGTGLPAVDAASEEDAYAILAAAGGWRQCPMWRGLGDAGTVEPAAVAAALRGVVAPAGMFVIDDTAGQPQKVWVGSSEDDATRGFGGSDIVHVDGATWTAIPDGSGWEAVRLDATAPDDSGVIAWQVRARAFPAPYCLADSIGGPPARVVEVPGADDPLVRLYAETGWFVCRTWQRMEQSVEPDGTSIDAAAEAGGVAEGPGWITTTVPADDGRAQREVRVYMGADPAIAGTRHGSQVVVLDTGEPRRAWFASSLEGRPFAVAFDVVRTPAGRIAWLPTPSAAGVVGDCPVDADGGPSSPVEAPSAGRDPPTVELLRAQPPAATMLAERLGWTGCRMVAVDPYSLDLPGTTIDRTAVEAGIEFGPLRVDGVAPGSGPVTVFLGDDVVDVARWTGDPVVAVDGRPVAWLADATRANEWRPIVTPAGRTAWVETGAATWPDGCDAPPGTEPDVAGTRSLTCYVERTRCLEAMDEAVAGDPSAFTDGTEVAVGPGSGCRPPSSCAHSPTEHLFVIAAPAGWASPSVVRVFITGRPWHPAPDEVPADEVAPAVLALAALPSIALPTPDLEPDAPADGGACRGAALRGTLRGDPWDPRVAWLDETSVRWPSGDTAVFVPDVRLIGRDGSVLATEGDEVRVVGTGEETDTGAFVACAVDVP